MFTTEKQQIHDWDITDITRNKQQKTMKTQVFRYFSLEFGVLFGALEHILLVINHHEPMDLRGFPWVFPFPIICQTNLSTVPSGYLT